MELYVNSNIKSQQPLVFNMIYFRAILGTLQNWVEGRDFPYTLFSYICITSPIISIFHKSSIFVKIDESTLIHYYHPESAVYIRIYSCVPHSMGLDKWIITCIHLYSIQRNFIALITLCAPPIYSSFPFYLWEPLIFLLSP